MSYNFKAGDTVRVRDPAKFISTFAKRIINRDAVVLWVGPVNGLLHGRAKVRFIKRNGSGKEFEEILWLEDLIPWPNNPLEVHDEQNG